MCSLFGILDYANYFNNKQKNVILSVLSRECEIRGTDATGIAYVNNGNLSIYKRAVAAHKMWYNIPRNANYIMGHTRMATQGSESHNYNNHPFFGSVPDMKFSLAHNGILSNDKSIRKDKKLPETKIQTDSYIAVQIIENEKSLTFESLKNMAETVRGSFMFTVLDEQNNIYFIKGDNPICICHFPTKGFYIYASTEEILNNTLKRLGLTTKLSCDKVVMSCGDILRVDRYGNIEKSRFDISGIQSSYCGYFRPYSYSFFERNRECDPDHLMMLKEMAGAFGYLPEDIDFMLADGFSLDEIENFFYEGEDIYFNSGEVKEETEQIDF